MSFFMHHQCPLTHSQHFFGIVAVQCHDRRLIDYNFIIMDNECVGGTEVYCYFLGKPVKKSHGLDLMCAKLEENVRIYKEKTIDRQRFFYVAGPPQFDPRDFFVTSKELLLAFLASNIYRSGNLIQQL